MIAKRMESLQASGIRKMFELAASMKNPINLSLGQADFDVPENVKRAAVAAIEEGKNRYSVTAGVPEFHEAVKEALSAEGVSYEQSMAICGASGGLVLALLALADESVEVLIPDPYFVSYEPLVRLAGATPRFVDTYPDFKLTPEMLRAAAGESARILLFNSPGNPSGIAYTAEEVEQLAKTARALGLTTISDEVYDQFCYDFPHESWLKYDSGAVLIRSFSKTGGMPGWRAGFACGPAAIIEQMKVLQQFTFVCVNTPSQWAAIEALKTDLSAYIDQYRAKRDLATDALQEVFSLVRPQGAFYLFPEVPHGNTEKFLEKCVERELLIVPGSAFSKRATHFRVSYALDDETLKRGVDLLCEVGLELQ